VPQSELNPVFFNVGPLFISNGNIAFIQVFSVGSSVLPSVDEAAYPASVSSRGEGVPGNIHGEIFLNFLQ
jgi:hypothetical protein